MVVHGQSGGCRWLERVHGLRKRSRFEIEIATAGCVESWRVMQAFAVADLKRPADRGQCCWLTVQQWAAPLMDYLLLPPAVLPADAVACSPSEPLAGLGLS